MTHSPSLRSILPALLAPLLMVGCFNASDDAKLGRNGAKAEQGGTNQGGASPGTGGTDASSGSSGIGIGGADASTGGSPGCTPGPDLCNGLDDDCDGIVDEECPGTGGSAGQPGTGGSTTCTPSVELCNGLDDDCNGIVDDDCMGTGGAAGQPGTGGSAGFGTGGASGFGTGGASGQPGTGGFGTGGSSTCTSVELCNGLDDDCNGIVDEGCTGTGGAAGGAGTGGASPACTDGGTEYGPTSQLSCSSCQDIESGGGGCCEAENDACNASPECLAIPPCIAQCNGDEACANQCALSMPDGFKLLVARLTCLLGSTFDPFLPGPGACGTACPDSAAQ